jgi:hypothetical protein
MFNSRIHAETPGSPRGTAWAADAAPAPNAGVGEFLRLAAMALLLALIAPNALSAQARGTMQVTARVLSGSTAWSGLALAGVSARAAAQDEPERPRTRRAGLVLARVEPAPSGSRAGSRGPLVITIHHPRN